MLQPHRGNELEIQTRGSFAVWTVFAALRCGILRVYYVSAKDGGAKEARTPDLLNAIQTLYQLSYDPIHETETQSKFFIP